MNKETEAQPELVDNMHGVRFYPVVTLGNLLMVFSAAVPVLVWCIRLEGRVDHEADLRKRLEDRVTEQANVASARGERVETLLSRINEQVTQLRIQAAGPGKDAR